MAGACIAKSAGRAATDEGGPMAEPVDRYVQLPLIFLAILQADGWRVAAYSHNTEPETWCLKARNGAVATIRPDGTLAFKGLNPDEKARLTAARDRARLAWSRLVRSRRNARV